VIKIKYLGLRLLRIKYLVLAYFLLPSNLFAAVSNNVNLLQSGAPNSPSNFAAAACIVVKLALDFIPYLFILTAGAFLMGLIKYISHGDNEEKMSEGRKMMVYGILGFFMMVSIWGILGLFTNSFGLGKTAVIPQFKSGTDSFSQTCK